MKAQVYTRQEMLIMEPEQVQCLGSAVRRNLLYRFGTQGPCSIASAAEQLNTYPEGLYHHVRKLVACGLLREVGSVRKGNRVEKLYDCVAERCFLRPHPWDVDYADLAVKMTRSEFEQAAKLSEKSLRGVPAEPDLTRYRYNRRTDCRLSADKIQELRKKLREFDEWLAEEEGISASDRPHSIFMSISPLE